MKPGDTLVVADERKLFSSTDFRGALHHASNGPAMLASLKPNMEVVAVDGMREDLDTRQFLTWFKMNYAEGDKVTLTVKQDGKEQEITYRLPRS